jgi:hypothetical protein
MEVEMQHALQDIVDSIAGHIPLPVSLTTRT